MTSEITWPAELDPRQTAILDALRAGNTRKAAAEHAGVHRDTFYAWLKANPTFSDMVTKAEAEAEVGYVGAVHAAARGGVLKKRKIRIDRFGNIEAEEEYTLPDWRAAAWWLERRRQRDFAQEQKIDLSKLTDEQIIRLLEDEAEAGGEAAEAMDPGDAG